MLFLGPVCVLAATFVLLLRSVYTDKAFTSFIYSAGIIGFLLCSSLSDSSDSVSEVDPLFLNSCSDMLAISNALSSYSSTMQQMTHSLTIYLHPWMSMPGYTGDLLALSMNTSWSYIQYFFNTSFTAILSFLLYLFRIHLRLENLESRKIELSRTDSLSFCHSVNMKSSLNSNCLFSLSST